MSITRIQKDLGLPSELSAIVGLWITHEDSDEFVISLHECWPLIANQKSHAVGKLLGYFEEGINFLKKKLIIEAGKGANREVDDYLLTCACFKELALLLNNEKSQAVRHYLVLAEKWARKEAIKRENSLKIQNKNLLASVSRLSREHEAHKVFSFAYHLISLDNLTAEYILGNRKFDFYQKRTDRLIITELKADKVTLGVIKNELVRDKDYLAKAVELAQNDTRRRTVVVKFLAPAFGDNLNDYLYAVKSQYERIEFRLTTWTDEMDAIRDRYIRQGHSVDHADREFAMLHGRLADIRTGRVS